MAKSSGLKLGSWICWNSLYRSEPWIIISWRVKNFRKSFQIGETIYRTVIQSEMGSVENNKKDEWNTLYNSKSTSHQFGDPRVEKKKVVCLSQR